MKSKLELFFLVGLSLFALNHVFHTIIYLAPKNPLTSGGLGPISKSYIDPIFSQNWAFFSPRPGIEDVSFEYRCFIGNPPQGSWIDLEEKRLVEHQNNHLLGLGRVLYLTKILSEEILRKYEMLLKSCYQETGDKKKCIVESKKNIMLTKEFGYSHTLFSKRCSMPQYSGYQFKIKVTKPIQFSKRKEVEDRELAYIEFPIIPYIK